MTPSGRDAGGSWERRLLVTGGAGFIGSRFVRLLRRVRPAWLVVNLDLLTYAADLRNLGDGWAERWRHEPLPYGQEVQGGDPGHVVVRGDVADGDLVERLFHTHRFDAVVHLAAESHVDRSILDAAPFVRTNVEGTRVLLEVARQRGVQRFVQVSTDEVYGDRDGLPPADEAAALRPSSPYAASKAAGDLLALAYWRTFGVPVIVTRSCNNYGPHQFPEKLIPLMIWKAAAGEPLPVYGDGQQRREWLYVDDHAEALLRALEVGRSGAVYHIGSGEQRTNLDVVRAICDRVAEGLGRPAGQVRGLIRHVQDRPGHDRLYAMASDRSRKELGWQPRTRFDEGLAKTTDWYLKRLQWVREVVSGAYREYYESVYVRGWKGFGKGGRGEAGAGP